MLKKITLILYLSTIISALTLTTLLSSSINLLDFVSEAKTYTERVITKKPKINLTKTNLPIPTNINFADPTNSVILDKNQSSAYSVNNANGEKQILIFTGVGECNKPLEIYNKPQSEMKVPDSEHNHPYGFTGFNIKCSGTTTVTVLLPNKKPSDFAKVVKAGNKTPGNDKTFGYFEIAKKDVVINGINGFQYSVTDGELGDDTGKDGYIVDPTVIRPPLQIVSLIKAFKKPVTTYDEKTDLSYTITLVNKGLNPVVEVNIEDDVFGGDPNIQVTSCDKGFKAPFKKAQIILTKELELPEQVYVITCTAKALKAGTKPIKNTVLLIEEEKVFKVVAPVGPIGQSDNNISTQADIAKDSISATPTPVPPPVPPVPPTPKPIPTPKPKPVPKPKCCNNSCCGGMDFDAIDNDNTVTINDVTGMVPTLNSNNVLTSSINMDSGDIVFNFTPTINNFEQ